MRIGHASIDEHNRAKGGVAGDQTGKEVCIRAYYDKNWNIILRPKDKTLANRSAVACEAMCGNPHIGYDQNERNTLLTYLNQLDWNYRDIMQNTECDCSSFMTACAICGGANIAWKGNAPTTRTMAARFKESGSYEVLQFVSPKHNQLKRGDILVKEGSHTVMVLDDYVNTTTTNTTTMSPSNMPTLRKGDRSDWVIIAQGRLVVAGYPLDVDGIFGQKTFETVKQFQMDFNLKNVSLNNHLTVDGIIGKNTWAALYK